MAKGIAHREWRIDRDEYRDDAGRIDEGAFRAAVQTELAMTEYIGERLGVAIVAAPIRTRISDSRWFTVGWAFRTATVPSAGHAKPEDTLDLAPDGEVIDFDALAEVE